MISWKLWDCTKTCRHPTKALLKIIDSLANFMRAGHNNQLWLFSGSSNLPWICSRLQWGGWTARPYRLDYESLIPPLSTWAGCWISWLSRSKLCQVWWFWGWSLWNALPSAMSLKSTCSAQEGGNWYLNYGCWFCHLLGSLSWNVLYSR